MPSLTQRLSEWWYYARNGWRGMAVALGYGMDTPSGIKVDADTAFSVSAIWACSKKLAEDVGSLPLHLHRETKSGKLKATDHPLYDVLHSRANKHMTAMQLRETLQLWLPNAGNAYAAIERSADRVIALWPMHPSNVKVTREGRAVSYQQKEFQDRWQPIPASDVLHLRAMAGDGYNGYGIFDYARDTIGLARVMESSSGRLAKNGFRMPGILKIGRTFSSEDQFREFRRDFEAAYGGPENVDRTMLLTGDVDFKPLGITPDQAQAIELRQFTIEEICRFYLMPPHLIMHLLRSTFNNIEHQDIGYSKHTLRPWVTRWEQAIDITLLTESERIGLRAGGRLYSKFNMAAIERGDFPTRTAGYATLLQNGVMSPDEVRNLEDLPPLQNSAGESYHIQLNMQTLPGTGTPTAAELAALAKINQGNGEANNERV